MIAKSEETVDFKDKQILREYLFSKKDDVYKKFNSTIVKTNKPLIGVRVPLLREIAKRIAKEDKNYSFDKNYIKYYEEYIIWGLFLGYLKIPFEDLVEKLIYFIPFISDWAVCDITAGNLKAFKKNEESGFKFCKRCLRSDNPWEIRFGLVLMMSSYKKTKLKEILDESLIVSTKNFCNPTLDYYLKMANGWLLSTLFIEDKEEVFGFLKDKLSCHKTRKIAIQKIVDSKRVSEEDKENVKSLRKIN